MHCIALYAHNTTLYTRAKRPDIISRHMQKYIDQTEDWSFKGKNQFQLNSRDNFHQETSTGRTKYTPREL